MSPKTKGKGNAEKKQAVRVWWAPTDDVDKTDYSGMFWLATTSPPVDFASPSQDEIEVEYDNGEKESVSISAISPPRPEEEDAQHGRLRPGEFVEVFNASETDPAYWLAKVEAAQPKMYKITFPFHDDAKAERHKEANVRRALVYHRNKWKMIVPFQSWPDGEVTSPLELDLVESDKYEDEYLKGAREAGLEEPEDPVYAGSEEDPEEPVGAADSPAPRASLRNAKKNAVAAELPVVHDHLVPIPRGEKKKACTLCKGPTPHTCACGIAVCIPTAGRTCYYEHVKQTLVGGAKRRKATVPRAAS